MKTTRLATMGLVMAMLCLGAFGLHAQGPRPDPENPFAGKIIEINYKSDPQHTELLKDVQIRTLGEKKFLVGVNVEAESYRNGLEAWCALDDAAVIAVFPSLEERAKRIAQ
jgi:hypothetical protein